MRKVLLVLLFCGSCSLKAFFDPISVLSAVAEGGLIALYVKLKTKPAPEQPVITGPMVTHTHTHHYSSTSNHVGMLDNSNGYLVYKESSPITYSPHVVPQTATQIVPPGANNTGVQQPSLAPLAAAPPAQASGAPMPVAASKPVQSYLSGWKKWNLPKFSTQIIWDALDYIKENKGTVATGAAGCAYALVNLQLIRWSLALQDASCWSKWKSDVSFTNLIALPRKVLGEQLIAEFAGRYQKLGHESLTVAITRFLYDCDHEYNLLESYISLGSKIEALGTHQEWLLKSCGNIIGPKLPWVGSIGVLALNYIPSCTNLFMLNRDLLHSCADRQARLNYLRETFMDYVMNQRQTAVSKTYFFEV